MPVTVSRLGLLQAEAYVKSSSQLVELQHTLYTSRNPTRRWLHCSRRDWIFDTLRRYSGAGYTRAVEIGPGSGVYLPVLAELFQEVTAVDIEESYLESVKEIIDKFPNISLAIADITSSTLPDERFDLILCTEVVEHIPNSLLALKEMHRMLRPGGILVLSTPQRFSPLELMAKIAFLPIVIDIVKIIYKEPILPTGHVNLLTEKEMTRQLVEAGFNILERDKSGMYLPVVAEFGGTVGLKLEQWLERCLRNRILNGLLWTQYYVAVA